MKFYITKISYNTEDGALPYIEGDITLEDTKTLIESDEAIKKMVEEYKETLKGEILEGLDQQIISLVEKCIEKWLDDIADNVMEKLDYRYIATQVEDYIDLEEYVDYDHVAETVNESYIDYDEIADQVHDLIDYEDIVNRVIEEIKERL